ncbi:hypothetical protein HAX54_030876 [Datura stramonium]|uniref:Uncharacterized protein n=1 Tax=Datura stramonium TaxID=4076 RepID=A0ABS8SBL4_DATST|nr:hypothetical protein [Datura stramonium]
MAPTMLTSKDTQCVTGWAAHDPSGKITPYTFKRRENGVSDVTIKILYCGMCRTDVHFAKNDWGDTIYPLVPGYEITGIIEKVGSKVSNFKKEDRVGVGYVIHMPDNLPLDRAAPLLGAGITVYTPMKDSHLFETAGKRIGVVGLGGLGHMAIKFGKAYGHHVTVLSTSPSKEKDAKEQLGADDFVVTSNEDEMKMRKRSLDFIVDTVSTKHSLGPYLELLKVNGILAMVGAPSKPLDFPILPLIYGKRTVKGSIIGSIKEIQEMMDFCGKHYILSDIEIVSTDRINEAFERLEKNDVKFRFVLDIAGKSQN